MRGGFDGFVQAAAAKTLQVETYESKTHFFKSLNDYLTNRLIEKAIDFVLIDFNSREIAVITHAKFTEAQAF